MSDELTDRIQNADRAIESLRSTGGGGEPIYKHEFSRNPDGLCNMCHFPEGDEAHQEARCPACDENALCGHHYHKQHTAPPTPENAQEFYDWWNGWLKTQKNDFNPKHSAKAAWNAARDSAVPCESCEDWKRNYMAASRRASRAEAARDSAGKAVDGVIDALDKHGRALHFQPTTYENVAELVDKVCETSMQFEIRAQDAERKLETAVTETRRELIEWMDAMLDSGDEVGLRGAREWFAQKSLSPATSQKGKP